MEKPIGILAGIFQSSGRAEGLRVTIKFSYLRLLRDYWCKMCPLEAAQCGPNRYSLWPLPLPASMPLKTF